MKRMGKFSNSVIFLAVMVMTLGIGLVAAADSFAQDNAPTSLNQTAPIENTTEISNQTDLEEASGQISMINRDL